MKNIVVLVLLPVLMGGCAIKTKYASQAGASKETKPVAKAAPEPSKAAKPPSVVVGPEDLQVMEKMNKAVEAYVLKNEKKSFKSLCKDKRFDCYVDEKVFPAGRKKTVRTVPPYASGSKMGLQGETRVHVRYDFYP
jgi:hypothetical protein